jgi:UDPglucose 6-dehydrogenase
MKVCVYGLWHFGAVTAACLGSVSFAYSPENLGLGDAIRVFTEPEWIVIGVRDTRARDVLEPLLRPFCDTLLWTRVESAEKHALNAFLAACVTFTNEVATVCERVGADMSEVEGAPRLDPRIGKRAYVRAGAAFGGGTLARDVQFLQAVAAANSLRVPVLKAVLESNREHKNWVLAHLQRELKDLGGKRIGVLGLAYKAGTDAIRRSLAVELLSQLVGGGAAPVAFDPKVAHLPESLGSGVSIASSADKVFEGADAVVLVTPWPEFQRIDFARAFESMRRKLLLIDQNAFVANSITRSPSLTYIVAGKV